MHLPHRKEHGGDTPGGRFFTDARRNVQGGRAFFAKNNGPAGKENGGSSLKDGLRNSRKAKSPDSNLAVIGGKCGRMRDITHVIRNREPSSEGWDVIK